MPSFLSILHDTDFSWLQNMQENWVSGCRDRLFLRLGLGVCVDIPSGPRLFEADGGGFLDDFFRLPMVQNGNGRARMPKEAGYKRCFDHHQVKGASHR